MVYIETLKRNIENLKLIGKVENMYEHTFSENEFINDNMRETLDLINIEVMNILKGIEIHENDGKQLRLRFDEPDKQLELFSDNCYLGITDFDISEAKRKVNTVIIFNHGRHYFAPQVYFNQSWFNHFNGLFYMELRKLNSIKYNKLARLWLFYSLCIVGELRPYYDLKTIGYTYITYITDGRKIPMKDYLFWNWVEELLDENFS